ncbi:DNA topoisomerase [Ruminococcaceae bacterium OttesenSCG-928-N02]|nr:DNA topoisomerase [Ruminococcaceae bacterium OttesenSCG-928-N02]
MPQAKYTNESITSLKGADRVRKRPAVIFGSDGIEGCQHAVFEILSNAIDEAREGFGTQIITTLFADGSVEVQDFGRGIPVDFNKNENKYNWELLFCELYAGGKYNNADGENYEYSLGLNGLGLCATQYSSAYMTADVLRDGEHFHLDFEKGENVGGLQKAPTKKKQTGTTIRWKPDRDVFTDVALTPEYFLDVIHRQAVVNAGVNFLFRYETGSEVQETTFYYERGIEDYLFEYVGQDALTPPQFITGSAEGRDRPDKPKYTVKMQAAFCFSNTKTKLEYYHNSSWLEHGGSPEDAVKSAFVSQIDTFLKAKNLYKKGERKIKFTDIEDSLAYVSSSFSSITSYANQTKKAITNRFIAQALTEFLRHSLEVYFIENPDEATKICSQVLVNMRAREQADQTRQALKKTLSSQMDLASRVKKFVDCRTKDMDRREIYIVEGDSALGACKTSRDAEFQAIIPVRGKILNCLKADYAKIFKNEIIVDVMKVLGCGVEVSGGARSQLSSFDINQLRWSKVIICTDADVDGYQIRTLILTMLYRLAPKLIEEGFVYIAETPLYEINSKGHTYFAYDEQEKQDALAKIGDAKYTIQRSKGLGENEADMMWLTTMNPETRRLVKVMPEDVHITAQVFDMLLGDNLAARKNHISENGHLYLDDLDLA